VRKDCLKAASHRIRLRLTIRLMANGSLHTGSVGRIRVNFLGFDRLPAYFKLVGSKQISFVCSMTSQVTFTYYLLLNSLVNC